MANSRSRRLRERTTSAGPRARVIVVSKRTHYGRSVEEERDPRVLRLLERRDPSVARWKAAHDAHLATLGLVERAFRRRGVHAWVLFGPRVVFDVSDATLVVTVGGDGTLLAASHHVSGVPILGVNSSPDHSVGFFCAAHARNLDAMLDAALARKLAPTTLTRMQVDVDGRVVSRRVLNEALFCHAIPAAASRYILRYGRRSEEQLSSGLWVGTAAGSTGALRSAGGDVLPLGSSELQLVVREPFAGGGHRLGMKKVFVEPGKCIKAVSKMNDATVFLDGPFLRAGVRVGQEVTFRASDDPIDVLGLDAKHARRRSRLVPRAAR